MALSKFTTITIGNTVVGSVSFGSPDQAGNRSFTFTPTGGTAQAAQSVLMARSGIVRPMSSNAPFTLTANGVTYDSLSGSVNIPNKTAGGQLHVQGTLEGSALDLVDWSSNDVVTPFPEEEDAASAAGAGATATAYK